MDTESKLREAVGVALDRLASIARSNNAKELEVKVGEMQKTVQAAVGDLAFVMLRRMCAFMQEDSLVSLAGLEHMGTSPPDSCLLETKFRYKVHGV